MGKATWKILPSSCFFLSLMISTTISQVEFAIHSCSGSGNFTTNSTYDKNLHNILSSIVSNKQLIDFGFYNFSSGHEPDKVNVIALCRGDVSVVICRTCVDESTQKILELCPNKKEATVWYNQCMIRYSDTSIFGVMNNLDPESLINGYKPLDPNGFLQSLRFLLDRLKNEAAAGDSTRKFAAGEKSAANDTVYGVVQCTPDLSYKDCNDCIGQLAALPLISTAGVGARIFTVSCILMYETNKFFDSPPTPAPPDGYPSPPRAIAAPPPTQAGKSGNTTRTIIFVIVPIVCTMILVVGICIILPIRTRTHRFPSEIAETDEVSSIEAIQFDFSIIRAATNDFSDENKLGRGGFGTVYKGRLANGQEIAVKRLSRDSTQGDAEFKNEVLLVAKLQHRNLVKLLGFCLKRNERLLIYEFVPNGSLDRFICDFAKRSNLDWEMRFKIIGGIARGLLYLHEDSRLRIIHRDLKVSNVLLDENMNPKISDFGMARLFKLDETHGNTSKIAGTYGYMAPEYVMNGQFSIKSDVYSFGVLVLEIVSGQKISFFRDGDDFEHMLTFAWRNWRAGTSINVIDKALSSDSRVEMMRCIQIGLLCVQENVADRPAMASVVLMLNSSSHALPMPSQPAFFMHSRIVQSGKLSSSEATQSTDSQSSSLQPSRNEASISDLHTR